MDDPLLVGVLHGLADRDGQLESLAERQPPLVAEPGDRNALDQLHHEVGASLFGGAGVEDLGDVGVVHQGQCLAFGPEPGQDLAAVHAGLDELQRDGPPHRLGLLGHVDRAHAPLADRLEEFVRADDRARAVRRRSTDAIICGRAGSTAGDSRKLPAATHGRRRSSIPPRSDSSPPQRVEERGTLCRVGQLRCGVEEALSCPISMSHGFYSTFECPAGQCDEIDQ